MEKSTVNTKNQLANQYKPLVHKIVNQMYKNSPHDYNDVLGYAWEGLALAINNYKEGTSQNFTQYAAYQIRFAILNGNNNEGHTVKFSAYNQGKVKEAGGSTWITKRIESKENEEGDLTYNIPELSYEDKPKLSDVYDKIYQYIESKFNKRDCDIFYRVMGLKNYDYEKGIDVSKMYHISNTAVTFVVKKIVTYIKQNKDLIEELSEFL